ncbi:hypothetical protein Tco_0822214 [Tanacetum coccineum]|uniref:Uncharacterized protein n=1 Tax=Tanacetum coccineum TaxID=301880 RepID=A0ABQ5AEF2_9ASTR
MKLRTISTVNDTVPSATEINAQVVPPGSSLSTTIAQDAPSNKCFIVNIDSHFQYTFSKKMAEENPFPEDTPNHLKYSTLPIPCYWRSSVRLSLQKKATLTLIKRVLSVYLKGTHSHGSLVSRDKAMSLTAYVLGCGSCGLSRFKKEVRLESLSFLEIYDLVSWVIKGTTTKGTALSTTEAGITLAMYGCCAQILGCDHTLKDYGLTSTKFLCPC